MTRILVIREVSSLCFLQEGDDVDEHSGGSLSHHIIPLNLSSKRRH